MALEQSEAAENRMAAAEWELKLLSNQLSHIQIPAFGLPWMLKLTEMSN